MDRLDGLLGRLCGQLQELGRRAAVICDQVGDALVTAAGLMGAARADIDAQGIVMVGLFTSNGWVDEVAGRDELFVGVEMFPDDERYGWLLLVHEAAHVVHSRVRPGSAWPADGVASTLLCEGLATEISAEATPGLPDAGYLWMEEGHEQWLNDCRRQWPDIVTRLIDDVDAEDLETKAVYFLMRDSARRGQLPRRCGYLVGWETVRRLRRAHSLAEMSRWDHGRAKHEVREALLSMS